MSEPQYNKDQSIHSVIPSILDVCCGTRMMWQDKDDKRTVFVDCRTESFFIAPGHAYKNGAELFILPNIKADFTSLPFKDESFYHVIFDPPHHTSKRLGKAGTGILEKKYGILSGEWKKMISEGFTECFRVLKPKGTLIFKWCETEIPLSRILKLTSQKPLYGHASGKKSQTHWMAFLKA